MKYPYLVLICAFFPTVFFSCSKSDNDPEPTPNGKITITSISPNRDSLFLGDIVTVTGKNFITDTSKITLSINGFKVPITSITSESLAFTIPVDFTVLKPDDIKGYMLYITMEGRENAYQPITIRYHEPQGWYYAATLSSAPSAVQPGRLVTFPTDTAGFVVSENNIYRTTNGGMTWTGIYHGFTLQTASSFDGKHVWFDFASTVGTCDDGVTSKTNLNGFKFDRGIIGLYMTSPTTGLVISQDQNLYYVNGDFTAEKISVKFRSKYFTYNDPTLFKVYSNWSRSSIIDEKNLMLAGFATIGGVPICIVTHEKDGVFTEYDLGAVTSAPYPKGVQLVDVNTAFLIDGNYDLLKLTGTTTWTKLNQKATAIYFKDANTGYAAYDGKLLKTTNGGVNWQTEFVLQPGETINSIYLRNGRIWAAVNNATDLKVLKYNP